MSGEISASGRKRPSQGKTIGIIFLIILALSVGAVLLFGGSAAG